ALERIPPSLKDLALARRAPGGIVALGYVAPGTATVSSRIDHAALLLMDAVLGGGKAARLFANLRDSRTGQSAAGYDVRTADFDTEFAARLDVVNADALNGFARRILGAPSAAAFIRGS